MPKMMIGCPICGSENWSFVRGKFTCDREREHTIEMIISAVLRYENGMVTVKTKLSFLADWTGPNAVYELDNRIVTKLYADGARFAIRLEDNAMTNRLRLYVNDEVVSWSSAPSDRLPEKMFEVLTGFSPEGFDLELGNRMSPEPV